MNPDEIRANSPIRKAYGLTANEAKEVEEVIQEAIKKTKDRAETIRYLRKTLRGKKLLFAIGMLEFHYGYAMALEEVLGIMVFPPINGGGES